MTKAERAFRLQKKMERDEFPFRVGEAKALLSVRALHGEVGGIRRAANSRSQQPRGECEEGDQDGWIHYLNVSRAGAGDLTESFALLFHETRPVGFSLLEITGCVLVEVVADAL